MQKHFLKPLFISILSLLSTILIGQPKKSLPAQKTNSEKLKSKNNPDFNIIRDTICSSWTLIVKTKKIDDHNFVCDRMGNIFFIKNEKRIDSQRVFKIVNTKIVDVQPCENGAYELGVDQNHDVILQTFPYENRRYYRYSTDGWHEMKDVDSIKIMKRGYQTDWWMQRFSLPKLSNKNASFHIVRYPSNLNFAISSDEQNSTKSNVYLYKNGEWIKYFDFFNGEENVSQRHYGNNSHAIIIQGRTIYFLDSDAGEIWMNNGNIVIKSVSERKEYINTPVQIVCNENERAEAENLYKNDIGIYEKGSKFGLRTKDGIILTRPLFDKITFEKSPNAEIEANAETFRYHLLGNDMDFYYSAFSVPDSNYIHGHIVSKEVCTQCKGDGTMEVTTIKSTTKLVEQKPTYQSSSRWIEVPYKLNRITNKYERVEMSKGPTYKEEVVIKTIKKQVACDKCNGKAIRIKRQDAVYDEHKMKYVTKTVTFEF